MLSGRGKAQEIRSAYGGGRPPPAPDASNKPVREFRVLSGRASQCYADSVTAAETEQIFPPTERVEGFITSSPISAPPLGGGLNGWGAPSAASEGFGNEQYSSTTF